jgi:hypothetical protein
VSLRRPRMKSLRVQPLDLAGGHQPMGKISITGPAP